MDCIRVHNFGPTREHPDCDVVLVWKWIEEIDRCNLVGTLHCLVKKMSCLVQFAYVEPEYRRRRISFELMHAVERRWPGVTTTAPQTEGHFAIPAWFALRARIMAADDPFVPADGESSARELLPACTQQASSGR